MNKKLVASLGALGAATVVSTTAFAVPLGTPVIGRYNPANRIHAAIQDGAVSAGLGSVNAVGFRSNCNPREGYVVVCRDKSLHGGATTTEYGATTCVVRLDPRLGNGPRAKQNIPSALAKCIDPPLVP